MDIKWKNNKTIRITCGIAIVLMLAIANLALLPAIQKSAESLRDEDAEMVDTSSFDEIAFGLYGGSYVLYLENLERLSGGGTYDASVFAEKLSKESEDYAVGDSSYSNYTDVVNNMNSILETTVNDFSMYRQEIDYAVFSTEDGEELLEANTTENLAAYVTNENKKEILKSLKKTYGILMIIAYDENGLATISDVFTAEEDNDLLLKKMQTMTKNTYFANYDSGMGRYHIEGPKNMVVAYGVPYTSQWGMYTYQNDYDAEFYYGAAGGYTLSDVTLIAIFAMTLIFICFRRKERNYGVSIKTKYDTLELSIAVMAVIIYCGWDMATELMWEADHIGMEQLLNLGISPGVSHKAVWCLYLVILFAIYFLWYACSMVITEVGVFGVREWIKRRSLIYDIVKWSYQKWNNIKAEMEQMDLSEDVLRKLRKAFWVEFGVLAVISCFWVFGIILLAIYCIAAYVYVRKQIMRIQADYDCLCKELEQLAIGRFDVELPDSLGQFDKANQQVKRVKKGFSQAVEREVRSQQMKTELVTNVSHDLKTPLTAIMTYIGLLQQENLTPEQEKEYLAILEQKSKRLKVLIEDLFDVSKANSNNLELQLQEVDIVSLIKQVATEHLDGLENKQLQVRYKVPDEKLLLTLDSQKAYRIYENLLVNVQKYALEGTRVFIKVYETSNGIVTSISNTSKEELTFDEDVITERFIRGDSSRNTEGSGLGLAIAKSFAHAMKGNLQISTEGDMFRVSIFWNK